MMNDEWMTVVIRLGTEWSHSGLGDRTKLLCVVLCTIQYGGVDHGGIVLIIGTTAAATASSSNKQQQQQQQQWQDYVALFTVNV